MKSKNVTWLGVIGGIVLLAGGLLANAGSRAPPPSNPGNPFQAILDKLDQVLAALTSAAAGQNNHTLRWDSNHSSDVGFTTAFTGAVLDKNTGLMWEQAPVFTGSRTWFEATFHCVSKNVGGTVGWRLPSVVELKSVQDPTLASPFVPASVFTGIQSAGYWSATTDAGNPANAWVVSFVNDVVIRNVKSNFVVAWCVRGPMNADAY